MSIVSKQDYQNFDGVINKNCCFIKQTQLFGIDIDTFMHI